MDAVANPYAPGAGRPPAALVGRDSELESWRVVMERLERDRTAQPMVLYGLRGVGKTVLLGEFAKRAESRGWLVAKLEAGAAKSLREALGEALHAPLADLAKPTAGARLKRALKTATSFKASYDSAGVWNFGIDLSDVGGGGANTGRLETDLLKILRDVSVAATESGCGLAVLIDEAQELAGSELSALCAAAHSAAQDEWRCALTLAGLPSLPGALAAARSYSERLFDFHVVEHLPRGEALAALTQPAATEGVAWDFDAAELVVSAAAGYPYFLQQFGQDSWNASAGPATIGASDARVGVATGNAALESGFYRARWDRATRSEQAYLRAMATDGDVGSSSGAVAARLGRNATSLGPARAKLIAKGLIYAPEHGVVTFTVPGMAAFIDRQPEL